MISALLTAVVSTLPSTNNKVPTLPTCKELGPIIQSTLAPTSQIGCNSLGCAFRLKGSERVLIITKESIEEVEAAIKVKLYLYGKCTDDTGEVNLITNFPGGDA
jgi:hypothetical protein